MNIFALGALSILVTAEPSSFDSLVPDEAVLRIEEELTGCGELAFNADGEAESMLASMDAASSGRVLSAGPFPDRAPLERS